jgi:hypothetical protein
MLTLYSSIRMDMYVTILVPALAGNLDVELQAKLQANGNPCFLPHAVIDGQCLTGYPVRGFQTGKSCAQRLSL